MTKLEVGLIAAIAVMLGIGVSAIGWSWHASRPETRSGSKSSHVPATPTGQPDAPPSSGAIESVRQRGQARIDTFGSQRASIDAARRESLTVTEAELDVYLRGLEGQARERGQVTATEVKPGLAALRRLYPEDPEQVDAFAQRMSQLSAELRSIDAAPRSPLEIRSELDDLLLHIRSGEDIAAIQVYTEKAHELPDVREQEEAIQRLQEILDGP